MERDGRQTLEDFRDKLGTDELLRVCGRTVAFVLAPNSRAAGAIEDAARAARDSQMPAVFIMADLSCADEALAAMRHLQRKGRTMMQASEFDFAAAYGEGACAGCHLEELPLNMLDVMRVLAESVLDVYEAVLVVDATQAPPTVEELYGLCAQLRKGVQGDEVFLQRDAAPSAYTIGRARLDDLAG